MVATVLCLLAICLGWCFAGENNRCHGVLTPDEELFNEVPPQFISLKNIVPGASYELKISYPATIPTDFTIEVRNSNASQSRRLLNIEKAQFRVEIGKSYLAVITAHRTGVSINPENLKKPAVFNIVLSTLHFGLPWEVWKLALLVLLSIISSVFWFTPWLLNYIERSTAHLKTEHEQTHVD